jgi:peptide/nickel transport system permease protein
MRYYVKRIGQSLLVLWAVITISFLLYRLLPGGPVQAIRIQILNQITQGGGSPTAAQVERANRLVAVYTGIRPDQPIYMAYLKYLWNVVHLDFGKSIMLDTPVFRALFVRMPWSMFISVYGLALGYSVSLLLGALMANTEGSNFDVGMSIFTVVNQTIPYYIVGILLIVIFGFNLGWFPTAGKMNSATTPGFNYPFMAGVVMHGTLPILSGFIAGFGGALAYRGNCIREKGKEYLRVGRLRGISENRLAIRYVGRNALLPIYTQMMVGIAAVFGSSIIIERIFNYQAVGLLTLSALNNRDYPLLMGSLIFFTVVTLLGILIADMTYGIIDPRIKEGGEREAF